ncbi:hypothetical protein E4U42_003199 [Claviceps africana]|uniref:Dynamin family protein n=1 Tax=Claviceps africana TaxID=83212 RepID=A0A8K0JDS5_9HYPO|nr:hypothetical protein E4U42_003199 [Claviceps africana]
MTTSNLRRHRGGAVHPPELAIKQEMEASHSSHHHAMEEQLQRDDLRSAASNVGGSTGMHRADHTLRNGRSDAPPPSERSTEPGPLLREIRSRAHISGPSAASHVHNPSESFFNISFQDIGKRVKACNDTLGELQHLGVSHAVQLPELVLVGDQSAGKSSLMSGLANLDLPRSEGTCTRCPLHIRVSENSDWSCRVSIRKEYSYQPPQDRPIHEGDVTDEDPFFPWRKQSSTVNLEFKTVHDKSQIEEVLRWAQIAILNDDKHHSLFIPDSGGIAMNTSVAEAAETTTAKFSPNIVSLEIKGPSLPDLSFYDMPGIFQNPADARDDYLVNVVRNLSKAYIQHPSAIIICAMPMNSDAENSSTFCLTRRLNAVERTIGVLTKADLLPEGGNHDPWLAVMRKQAHMTGLGYFITSRPQNKDLEDLKRWEEHIFEDHSVGSWPSDFHEFFKQCGVERLKSFLSERLGQAFIDGLPNIKRKLEQHFDKIHSQLKMLPELPENVELEIQTGLMRFADSSRVKLDEFMKHFNTLPQNFRKCLLAIKPKFTLKDSSDHPVLEISDDDSDNVSVNTNQTTAVAATPSGKRRSTAAITTPSKRPRVEAPASGVGPPIPNGRVKPEEQNGLSLRGGVAVAPGAQNAMLSEPFSQFTNVGRGFRTLRQIHEEIEAKTTSGMPDRISDEVYQDLITESVRPWKEPMDVFITRAMQDLLQSLGTALNKSLENLKKRSIYKKANEHLRRCIEEHKLAIKSDLDLLYHDEVERVLTFNEEAFKQYKAEELFDLTRFRHYMRMKAIGPDPGRFVPLDQLSEDKRVQDAKKRETELARIGPDRFKPEIEVVAYVRGYYRLAALRFADAVSQRIICRMIPSIRRELPFYMEKKLGLRRPDAANVYVELMEEDEKTAETRKNLKIEKEKFEKALASIGALETGSSGNMSELSMTESLTDAATQRVEQALVDDDGCAGVEDGDEM